MNRWPHLIPGTNLISGPHLMLGPNLIPGPGWAPGRVGLGWGWGPGGAPRNPRRVSPESGGPRLDTGRAPGWPETVSITRTQKGIIARST